jgi:Uma2 family endonuclease
MPRPSISPKRQRGSAMTSPTPVPGAPAPLPPAVPDEPIYRLSVDQYHKMIAAGIIDDDDPVELLEGWLVQKMGKNPPHSFSTGQLRTGLESVIPAGWYVDSQEPVTGDTSEPEPDARVVRGKRRDYLKRHPRPDETPLVGEVSDSTLRRDRGFKMRIYARAGILVYWIVNLIDRQIEVYTDPTGPAKKPTYRQRQDYKPGEEVPVVIEGREVGRLAVKDLLP